jgi:iron(III) transport system permease protein
VRYLVPLAFPALVVAAALGALLAWSDAPSARALAVPTLAVGMLDQWSAREDASAGALLGLVVAAIGLLAASALLAALSRTPSQDDARLGISAGRRVRLRGGWGALPWLLAAPQLVLGVLVPMRAMTAWSIERITRVDLATLGADAGRTVLLACSATLLAAALALPILHALAFVRGRRAVAAGAIAFVPFALPATMLGAAVLWMLPSGGRARLGALAALAALLHGTLLPLVMALGVHFAAVFVGAGHAALRRHGGDHLAVMRLTGHDGLGSFVGLLRPFLARPAAAAAAFVFLECLKDVQLTVVLAPFGFQSISARVFQLAQTERIRDCAVWMVCLALIGLYPLMTLARLGEQEEPVTDPC